MKGLSHAGIKAARQASPTTIWSGWLKTNFPNLSAGQESAKEQPAFKSGTITFFVGFNIVDIKK